MCIRHSAAPSAATTGAISGSARSAVTSLTIVAPACSAGRATSAFEVSIEICALAPAAIRPSITGSTRRSSSAAVTGSAPGTRRLAADVEDRRALGLELEAVADRGVGSRRTGPRRRTSPG